VIRACRQHPGAVRANAAFLNVSSWTKEAMGFPEVASQSLAVLSLLAVRIRVPSSLNAACRPRPHGLKEATSLPEAASQTLAVLSKLAVTMRAPSGLNAASLTSS